MSLNLTAVHFVVVVVIVVVFVSLTALQSLLARFLNSGEFLSLSGALWAALGNLKTPLNDFTGEPGRIL